MKDFIQLALEKSQEIGVMRGLLMAERILAKSSSKISAQIALIDAIEGKLKDSSSGEGSLDPSYSEESKNPCGSGQAGSGPPQGTFTVGRMPL